MFTGLVEASVPLRAASRQSADHLRLVVQNPWPGDAPATGASVAVDGVCLTVVPQAAEDISSGFQAAELAAQAAEISEACKASPSAHATQTAQTLAFVVGPETLARTTLAHLVVGSHVHLERALAFGDRLGGHLVSGHVDGVGTVKERSQQDDSLYLAVQVPAAVAELSAAQGAITLAGVSLTLTKVAGDVVWICLIPHTLAVTKLGALQVGDLVNCEADMLARYLARLLDRRQHAAHAAPAGAPPQGDNRAL